MSGLFEYYFCPRTFGSLAALNQHLASPKHSGPDVKAYKYPKRDCGKECMTLCALVQHIEGGSCGVRRIAAVDHAMEQLMRGTRSLAL